MNDDEVSMTLTCASFRQAQKP